MRTPVQQSIAEYLARDLASLREQASFDGWGECADFAYDVTLEKFAGIRRPGTKQGYDPEKYLGAVSRIVDSRSYGSILEREAAFEEVLGRMVRRHFFLALKECRRNADRTRYRWELESGAITVLLPRGMHGSSRKQWLMQNVPSPDGTRPGEEARIQAIIDEKIGATGVVPLDESLPPESLLQESDLPWIHADRISTHGLAEALAQEKADRIDEQRPSIRKMGRNEVKNLVLRVFEAIGNDVGQDGVIAAEFGLDKATFSRFAGSRWSSGGKGGVPDLWRNLAGLLASHPLFVESCQLAGVWPTVSAIASPEVKSEGRK